MTGRLSPGYSVLVLSVLAVIAAAGYGSMGGWKWLLVCGAGGGYLVYLWWQGPEGD